MSAPQVGDVLTTAEEFDGLPAGAIAVQPHGGILRRVEGKPQHVSAFLPATLVWLPGQPPTPERLVRARALREAADEVYGDERAKGPYSHPLSIATWLRDRAGRIERGDL